MTEPLSQTPSQTVGPFFGLGLPWPGGETLVEQATQGERITLVGRVVDGDGAPVPDALIEIWQADAAGHYASPTDSRDGAARDRHFRGFGRCATDGEGQFRFATIKPGRVPGPGGVWQAPHIEVAVFARGLLKALFTRCYFPGEESNAADPVLALVPEGRRATLIATAEHGDDRSFRFDIVLQGRDETVFLAC